MLYLALWLGKVSEVGYKSLVALVFEIEWVERLLEGARRGFVLGSK